MTFKVTREGELVGHGKLVEMFDATRLNRESLKKQRSKKVSNRRQRSSQIPALKSTRRRNASPARTVAASLAPPPKRFDAPEAFFRSGDLRALGLDLAA